MSIGLFFSVKKNLFLFDKLDLLDTSLIGVVELLETQHEKMVAKSKIEVFSDEPIVRELVRDITTACDAVKKSSEVLRDVVDSLQEEINEQDDS